MNRILLVNLMRMGDVLQTSPLIEGLRRQHPDARIEMVLNEAFAGIGERVGADALHRFPVQAFREMLVGDSFPFEAHDLLTSFVRGVHEGGPCDRVFNQTPSKPAAALASLFRSRERRGFMLESDGSYHPTDPWTTYLITMMPSRRTNPFHLVDIWLRGMGVEGARRLRMRIDREEEAEARELLVASGLDPDRHLLVGIQSGASQSHKCWGEREIIRVARRLHRSLDARVVFFGVDKERGLCERLAREVPGATNLAGRTGLGVLGAILARCGILISNDTGTLHVATAVGTPVLVLSLGPVFFQETGPLGEGHRVLQARLPCAPCSFKASCLHPVCKEKIRADHVYGVAVKMLQGDERIPATLDGDVSCYRSGFDDRGFLVFTGDGSEPEERKRALYKALWLAQLEGVPVERSLPGSARELEPESREAWSRLLPLLERAAGLIDQMRSAACSRAGTSSRFRVLTENLRQVEREMERLGLEVLDLQPFVKYLFVRREAMSFQDPLRFLEGASSLYARLAQDAAGCIVHPTEEGSMCHGRP